MRLLILLLFITSCKEHNTKKHDAKLVVEFNKELADELEKMAEIDQVAAYIPQGKYQKLSKEEWNSFKDSVFLTHQKRLSQIFDKHGYAGIDLVGEEGSKNFWLMVQHSDHDPEFQKAVLKKMKKEVDKGNASSENYGLLVDRVQLNTGFPQVYGTQVIYNMNNGQAYPKSLRDSASVNSRRKEIGLEPIEDYLNGMTEMHFRMNKKYYLEKGITGPTLYKTNEN